MKKLGGLDLGISEMISGSNRGMVQPKQVARLHEFYLTGDIESPENYVDWFDTIRHATENDIIKIYINSYGGDLYTAIQFIRVMGDSAATIICSVEGACMSAATLIFLCGHSYEVTPHSVFMFHNYSGGTFGKGGEMIDQLLHERKWSERLFNSVYKNFLSEDEIKAMLDNKDIWLDGDEVVKRIENMVEIANNELDNSEDSEDNSEDNDVPSEPLVKPKKKSAKKA